MTEEVQNAKVVDTKRDIKIYSANPSIPAVGGMQTRTRRGLKLSEILRLHSWFQARSERTFMSFWEEAFSAGVEEASYALAPKLTEKEAVEIAAQAIEKSAEDSRVPTYQAMAKAALRAAGMRFKEEA